MSNKFMGYEKVSSDSFHTHTCDYNSQDMVYFREKDTKTVITEKYTNRPLGIILTPHFRSEEKEYYIHSGIKKNLISVSVTGLTHHLKDKEFYSMSSLGDEVKTYFFDSKTNKLLAVVYRPVTFDKNTLNRINDVKSYVIERKKGV